MSAAILLKEIDLERFYTHYRLTASADPKWRHLRYFAAQESGAALFTGSEGATMIETGSYLRRPSQIRNHILTGALQAGLVGSAIAGGSSLFELCSNVVTAVKNKAGGKDPESARRAVAARLRAIDGMLERRAALVGDVQPSERTVYENEARVLKAFRDWCLYEFATIYADARSYQASNNVYYAISAAGLALFVVSYGQSVHSFRNADYIGPAAVTGTVGSAVGMASSPAGIIYYKKSYAFFMQRLSRQLSEKIYDAEPAARSAMDAMAAELERAGARAPAQSAGVRARLALCRLWADRYDEYVEKRQSELRRLAKVSLQNGVSGPLIYGSFLAQDILADVAAYRLKSNLASSNAHAFAGAIAPTAGSAASLALTTAWFIDDERQWRRLRRQGQLPSQLIARRLSTLDELEQKLQ